MRPTKVAAVICQALSPGLNQCTYIPFDKWAVAARLPRSPTGHLIHGSKHRPGGFARVSNARLRGADILHGGPSADVSRPSSGATLAPACLWRDIGGGRTRRYAS